MLHRQVDADMTTHLRAFEPGDDAAARALWRESEGVGLGPGDAEPELRAFLARNPGFSWVAVDGGELVGAVLCGHDGRRGFIYHLAVRVSHRRRGLGRALVERCVAALSAAGIQRGQASVFADNELAKRFWASVGARPRPDLALFQIPLGASADGRSC
jgi:ribosomal protein S18 acetylase RimI-like enzyme